jgi:CheY-like chemotaxis protein
LLSGRRVLVVEDEMLVLIMIEDMLVDLGCESVTAAATIAQALALIEAQVFDVAMLDMNLNGSQPYSVADALAARIIPFVFSTGYSGHDRTATATGRC